MFFLSLNQYIFLPSSQRYWPRFRQRETFINSCDWWCKTDALKHHLKSWNGFRLSLKSVRLLYLGWAFQLVNTGAKALAYQKKETEQFFQPIKSKGNPTVTCFTRVFPHLARVLCFYVEFWLVHAVIYTCCDWPSVITLAFFMRKSEKPLHDLHYLSTTKVYQWHQWIAWWGTIFGDKYWRTLAKQFLVVTWPSTNTFKTAKLNRKEKKRYITLFKPKKWFPRDKQFLVVTWPSTNTFQDGKAEQKGEITLYYVLV